MNRNKTIGMWEVLRRIRDDHSRDYPTGFTVGDIRRLANEIDPAHSRRMIEATFYGAITNIVGRLTTAGARPHRAAEIDVFFQQEDGRYRPYVPGVDPTPLYFTGRRRDSRTTDVVVAATIGMVEAVTPEVPNTTVEAADTDAEEVTHV